MSKSDRKFIVWASIWLFAVYFVFSQILKFTTTIGPEFFIFGVAPVALFAGIRWIRAAKE